jgi:hypothetical protein
LRKATLLLFAMLASIATLLLTGTASASTQDFKARAVVSAPGTAADAGIMRDGCVETEVYRRAGQPNTLDRVLIRNVCSYSLSSVDGHTWNGPAGFDWRSPGRATLPSLGYWEFKPTWAVYLPPGSLTCGELWGPGGVLHGRDCKTM